MITARTALSRRSKILERGWVEVVGVVIKMSDDLVASPGYFV
jgi:hypothetical protein